MPTQSPAVGSFLSSLQPSATLPGSLALVAQSPPSNSDDSTSTRQEAVSIGALVLLVVGVLLLRQAYLRRKARSRAAGRARPVSLAIPCLTCRYFHPNAFLACAVNPAEVMSQSAANCKDYCPRQVETAGRSAPDQD